MELNQILLLPIWYAVFLLSVTFHESAHAWAAYRGGDPTAYLGGQVSLNPLPHVQREPFGTILVPLMSFVWVGYMMGWASAPYDPSWEDRHPRRAAWMAAAGPLANLLLATAGFVLLKVGLQQGLFVASPEPAFDSLVVSAGDTTGPFNGLARFGSVLMSLNFLLFLFNLIPLPPFDGAAIVGGLIPPAREPLNRIRGSSFGAMGGLLLAVLTFPWIFDPIYWQTVVYTWLYG